MLTTVFTRAREVESTATARSAVNDGGPIEWSVGRSGAATAAAQVTTAAGAITSRIRDLRNMAITLGSNLAHLTPMTSFGRRGRPLA